MKTHQSLPGGLHAHRYFCTPMYSFMGIHHTAFKPLMAGVWPMGIVASRRFVVDVLPSLKQCVCD
jgi:hypothetical protein